MGQRKQAVTVIAEVKSRFRQRQVLTRKELHQLLGLCRHADKEIREAALALLLHPPVADELAHYRWLIPAVLGDAATIADLPAAFMEFVCDLIGLVGKVPDFDHRPRGVRRILSRLPPSSLAGLLSRPLPVRPFLRLVPVWVLQPLRAGPPSVFRRRWRLLRKSVAASSASNAADEITWADLRPLWKANGGGHRGRAAASRGRWRLVGRSLSFKAAGSLFPAANAAGGGCSRGSGLMSPAVGVDRGIYFGGLGSASLRYLETLMRWQAKELAAVRELALRVSRHTRRVVLSWHNASLAAAGGWAFEHLAEQFPSPKLWRAFRSAVASRVQAFQSEQTFARSQLRSMVELWTERLVKPKLAHALWESKVRAALDDSWLDIHRQHVQMARAILDDAAIGAAVDGERYGWPAALSPFQRMGVEQIMGWAEERQKILPAGLIGLACMLREGQRLMNEGDLPCLVLPWIDKFFVSSRRAGDLDYLPLLVRWLAETGSEPLILFWEDTAHAQAPSFHLALKKLAERQVAFRGIGIFDHPGSDRSAAFDRICREHARLRLFALRPYSDEHYARSFHQLLRDRDYRFFAHYDSSWKDNLCFLYAGTQVFPLLSVPSDMETLPAWIGAGGKKHPFGTYWRKKLRARVLDRDDEGNDEFSASYAYWANLC